MAGKRSRRANRKVQQKASQRQRLVFGGALGVVALIAVLFAVLRNPGPAQEETAVTQRIAPEVGAQAPDFELVTNKGETVKLSDFRGVPVAINFMHTW